MRGMVTGDQSDNPQHKITLKGGDAGTADGPGDPGFIKIERVTGGELDPADVDDSDLLECSCKWRHMDTGNMFHSQIAWSNPHCPVHKRT